MAKSLLKRISSVIKERRLPDVFIRQWRIFNYFVFGPVRNTPPAACNQAAEVQIHSLVAHQARYMYLLSIKSFLRYYSDVAVIAHDDGTLTASDIRLLEKHVHNIRVIKRDEADLSVRKSLNDFSDDLRRKNVLFAKLFDVILLGGSRIIVLDSDTVFLHRPDEIIDWIIYKDRQPFFTEEYPWVNGVCEWGRLEKETGLGHFEYLNTGLIGFYNDIGIAEIQELAALGYRYRNVNCNQLWQEQVVYSLLLKRRNAMALPRRDYPVYVGNNYNPQAKAVHFSSGHRFHDKTYMRCARQIISEL